MTKKIALLLALVPTTSFALTYERQSLLYADAPFLPANAAGISILTNLGAVQGYPDGSFYPDRTLNRAEFLKIVLSSHPNIRASNTDAANCFPDVQKEDWFSMYVCLAKTRGIIAGYPDGTFGPAKPVNYAEALKILSELYGYTMSAVPNAQWWEMYVQAATSHKTILPIQMSYDRNLTRGNMARLAAAYRAEYDGELSLYRRMEKGEDIIASSSSSSESISSSEESIASSASSSSADSSAEQVGYASPTTSHLFLVGKQHIIGDALLYAQQRDASLRVIKVVLDKEARSLEYISLVNEDDELIAKLQLDVRDNNNETWYAELPGGSGSYTFIGGEGTRVFIKAKVHDWNNRGFSQDYIKIKSMFVVVGKINSPAETYQIVPTDAHYPVHQTALANITSVESATAETGKLASGVNQLVAAFQFKSTQVVDVVRPKINHLRFYVDASADVTLSNITVKSGSSFPHSCSTENSDDTIINCLLLPDEIGSLPDGLRTIELHATIDASSAAPGAHLQVNMLEPGSRSVSGDIRYTDGSTDFTWVDLQAPLANGQFWLK